MSQTRVFSIETNNQAVISLFDTLYKEGLIDIRTIMLEETGEIE